MAQFKQFITQWVQTAHMNLHLAMSLFGLGFSEIGVMMHHAMLRSEISCRILEPRVTARN